jgi:hypothetical protein
MLNFCGIVVAILKMAIGRNFSISGHHYLATYTILMISYNVEFLPPIFYAVFWQPYDSIVTPTPLNPSTYHIGRIDHKAENLRTN